MHAGSPAGPNRFKAAPKLVPWTGVRDALAYGARAIQPPDPGWPKDWKPAPADEMCLYLNVWTPGVGDGRKRPVMFYSHGGLAGLRPGTARDDDPGRAVQVVDDPYREERLLWQQLG